MIKRGLIYILISVVAFGLFSGYLVGAEESSMAYTVYAAPVIEDAVLFDTYTVDFCATKTPANTYWSLCNFRMCLSEETKKEYEGINGGGGTLGVQKTAWLEMGNKVIFSLNEYQYGSGNALYPERMYTLEKDLNFGSDSGGNVINGNYDWQDNRWYRMVLHSWQDAERGTTFVGMWLLDITSGEWTTVAVYDTKLKESCLAGKLQMFMENYVGGTDVAERDVQLKNIYVKLHRDRTWLSADTLQMWHCNNITNNKSGMHDFGATEEYFFAISGGKVENQAAYDSETPVEATFSIRQNAEPFMGKPAFQKLVLRQNKDKVWCAQWEMDKTGTPQLTYSITVKDVDGNILFRKTATRPEVVAELLDTVTADSFLCEMTVTDIYGGTVTQTVQTDAYTEAMDEKTPLAESPSLKETNESEISFWFYGGIFAVIAVIVIAGVYTIMKTKK